jgi:hypothetical protein
MKEKHLVRLEYVVRQLCQYGIYSLVLFVAIVVR